MQSINCLPASERWGENKPGLRSVLHNNIYHTSNVCHFEDASIWFICKSENSVRLEFPH